jgi:ribonuclease P protein component
MKATTSQTSHLKSLIKRSDFLNIQKTGKKCVAHGLILQARPNDLGHIRIGYTVTKRTEASSVKRNRIKRRLRAAAADVMSQHAENSCDYVLIGRPATTIRPYESLCEDLRWCLGKIGHRKNA